MSDHVFLYRCELSSGCSNFFFGKILIFDDALPQGPCTQHSLESCGALRARLRYAVHLRGTPVLAKVYCGGAE